MKTKLFAALIVIVLLLALVPAAKADGMPAPGDVVEITGRLMATPGYWIGDDGVAHAVMTIGIIEGVPMGGSAEPEWLTVKVICTGDLADRVHANFQEGETVWVRGKVLNINAYPNQYTLKAWNAKVIHE